MLLTILVVNPVYPSIAPASMNYNLSKKCVVYIVRCVAWSSPDHVNWIWKITKLRNLVIFVKDMNGSKQKRVHIFHQSGRNLVIFFIPNRKNLTKVTSSFKTIVIYMYSVLQSNSNESLKQTLECTLDLKLPYAATILTLQFEVLEPEWQPFTITKQ